MYTYILSVASPQTLPLREWVLASEIPTPLVANSEHWNYKPTTCDQLATAVDWDQESPMSNSICMWMTNGSAKEWATPTLCSNTTSHLVSGIDNQQRFKRWWYRWISQTSEFLKLVCRPDVHGGKERVLYMAQRNWLHSKCHENKT